MDQLAFSTPDGEVTCEGSVENVICEVTRRSWDVPENLPVASNCEDPNGFVLDSAGVQGGCGDFGSTGATVVGYGTTLHWGPHSCNVQPLAVTCRNERSGSYFSLSTTQFDFKNA